MTEFQAVITHEAFVTDSEAEGTSVSFSLSDPDIDDEFVVDVYYDEYYGTFIFNTVAGRSKCVWEKGTGRSEDPSLVLVNPASSFVYPNENMVFEVEMKNSGRTGDSFFYVAQEATSRNLDVKLGGTGIINENGIVLQLYKGNPVMKQIIISRGLLAKGVEGYEFPAVYLTLKSKCEADMNARQNTRDGMYTTIPLFNHVNEAGQEVLRWMKPCPKIHWSGNLNRERKFLINRESKEQNDGLSVLKVQIFNPLASQGEKIVDIAAEENLKNVYLRYRKTGSIIWNKAESSATLDSQSTLHKMDFLDPNLGVEEDSYGFASLYWRLDNLEGINQQGKYEIMLETKCAADSSSPEEVQGFQEEIINGLFDLEPPKQYGEKVLPLRNDIIYGEEIKILFTENIRCTKPHSFKIEVDIIGTNYIGLENNGGNIQVICKENQLGFQVIDITDPTLIAGKEFHVTITEVEDEARNAITNAIKFKKQFANLDFEAASTTFKFTIHSANCSEESVETQSDDVRSEIASNIGLDSEERIKIHELTCIDGSKVIADAEIEPVPQDRRLKNLFRMDDFFSRKKSSYELVNAFALEEKRSRSLLKASSPGKRKFSIGMVGLKPSKEDRIKFSSSPNAIMEESTIITSSLQYMEPQMMKQSNLKTEEIAAVDLKEEMKEISFRLEKEKNEEIEELKILIRGMKEDEKQGMNKIYLLQTAIVVAGCMALGLSLFRHH